MKALKVIGIILLILIVAFLVVGLFLPKSASTERSISVNAPAEVVFEQVNNLQNWENWSPFYEADTNMEVTYGELFEGVGASYSWTGEMGYGTLKIKESEPFSSITNEILFDGVRPGYGKWTIAENEDGTTEVSWKFGMEELNYPLGRYYGLFLDAGMEPFLISGLENLKEVAENAPEKPVAKTGVIELLETQPQAIIAIKDSVHMDDYSSFYEKSYGAIMAYMGRNSIQSTGYPISVTHYWDSAGASVIEAAMPVAEVLEVPDNENGMYSRMMEGSQVLKVSHWGPYETVGMSYEALEAYMMENSLEENGPPYEVYITDPASEPDPSKWETQIVWPVKAEEKDME